MAVLVLPDYYGIPKLSLRHVAYRFLGLLAGPQLCASLDTAVAGGKEPNQARKMEKLYSKLFDMICLSGSLVYDI